MPSENHYCLQCQTFGNCKNAFHSDISEYLLNPIGRPGMMTSQNAGFLDQPFQGAAIIPDPGYRPPLYSRNKKLLLLRRSK